MTAQPQKRMKAPERRQNFLDAAHKIVREQGAERLTMDGLAAECGVNKVLPYRFFKNRDDVLVALYLQSNEELDAVVLSAVESAKGFEERISAVVNGWFDYMASGRDLPSLMEARTQSGELESIREQRIAGIVEFVADEIMAGRTIKKKQAMLAAAVLVAGTQGLMQIVQSTPLAARDLAKSYIEMAMGAIDRVAGK